MKRIFTILVFSFITAAAFAQVPQLMNYQAVARNAQGQALASQTMNVRLTLQEGGGGIFIPYYIETRSITTNALGLFNVQIGSVGATSTVGSLNATNWQDASRIRQLKVEMDIAGNGSWVDMGSQRLVSVPYAFAAETARRISTPFVGVFAEVQTPVVGSTLEEFTVPYDYEHFDSSSSFNTGTHEFTVPSDGIYDLTASLNFGVSGPTGGKMYLSFYSNTRGYLNLRSNLGGGGISVTSGLNHLHTQILYPLNAGEKISVLALRTDALYTYTIYAFGTSLSIYKVR